MSIWTPTSSWESGFAQNASESDYPNMRKHLLPYTTLIYRDY